MLDLPHIDPLDHGTDPLHRVCPSFSHSMLQRMASVPDQSFPEPWRPVLGAQVTVFTGGDAQQWRISHIKKGIGTSVTITHESSVMTVDKSWFMLDTDTGRLVLQRLGFFGDNHLKRTTNSYEIWRNILHPDRMMDGEILMVLLEWTMQGQPGREELGLPPAQDTSWLVDRSFWQSWVLNNEPQAVNLTTRREWMCIDREPTWGTEVHHFGLCQFLETGFSKRAVKGEVPMRSDNLLVLECSSIDFLGTRFTTCDYIHGTKGYYMPRENFLYFRKSERMIAKTTPPSPIHLLDHIIIPIHIRESHWFPAHINLRTYDISLLDSSQDYSAAAYPLQRMLIWKFIRMVWATHTATAPAPLWIIPPERLIDLHPRLTNPPPSVIQSPDQGTTQAKIAIMNTSASKMTASWIQRGISPAMIGSRPYDPRVQPWTFREKPGTPQQNNFKNTSETRLACGIYTVLGALYAIRNWDIDFVQQTHIRQARHWMAAIGHAIHEVVSLHRCSCGSTYEQWECQPTPPCPTCGRTSLEAAGSGTKKRAHDDTTNQTSEANPLTPSPVPFTGHKQNYRPKQIGERSGPTKKPGNSKPITLRSHFPRVGGQGLRNDGNTCFLNAVIQCLGGIDEVYHAHKSTIKPTTTLEKLMNCVRDMQLPGTAYVPTSLIQQIPHLICYKKGDPADAHELLIAMINDFFSSHERTHTYTHSRAHTHTHTHTHTH